MEPSLAPNSPTITARHFNTGLLEDKTLEREAVERDLAALVTQKNYPCIAALRAFHKGEIEVGTYGRFGTGESWRDLRKDLLKFIEDQKTSNSIYLTYFAAFEEEEFNEDDFEVALWNELSHLTSVEDRATDWPEGAPTDPNDQAFKFSLAGTEFFVVGLHANSSRKARRFTRPALIFNVFNQFEQLEATGQYEPMVELNRSKDMKFQGDVNPMVAIHGDKWETIQFSGKTNSNEWKCPFHFLMKFMKK